MKCDMRFVEPDQVELRLVMPRTLVDPVIRETTSYGQACRVVREAIEASLKPREKFSRVN